MKDFVAFSRRRAQAHGVSVVASAESTNAVVPAIRTYLAGMGIVWDSLSPPERTRLVRDTREQLRNNRRLSLVESVAMLPAMARLAGINYQITLPGNILRLREARAAQLSCELKLPWTNRIAMNDNAMDEALFMAQRFGVPFSSTYFDSAAFGLLDLRLDLECRLASMAAHDDHFEVYTRAHRNWILEHFAPERHANAALYAERHVHFAPSASVAFGCLLDRACSSGQTLVVSGEEYGEFLTMMRTKGLSVISSGRCNDDIAFVNTVELLLDRSPVAHLLISEVSRRGTRFPLARIRDMLDKRRAAGRPPVSLFVDGTQALGRVRTQFYEFRPDAYFASCYKGADAGFPGAVLILSRELGRRAGPGMATYGTQDTAAMHRIAIACNPVAAARREERLRILSAKFLTILDRLNSTGPQRVRVLFPSLLDRPEQLTGIFELEVDGLSRSDVSTFARTLGVFIAGHYYAPAQQQTSFRIALHPAMNEYSLLLLGYVLAHATPPRRRTSSCLAH